MINTLSKINLAMCHMILRSFYIIYVEISFHLSVPLWHLSPWPFEMRFSRLISSHWSKMQQIRNWKWLQNGKDPKYMAQAYSSIVVLCKLQEHMTPVTENGARCLLSTIFWSDWKLAWKPIINWVTKPDRLGCRDDRK